MTESADPPAERIKIVGDIADLLARRHSPGGHWKSLDDVQPNELVDIIVDDAVAIADLVEPELGRLRTTLTETQAERDRLAADNAEWDRAYMVLNESSRANFERAVAAEAALATTQAELELRTHQRDEVGKLAAEYLIKRMNETDRADAAEQAEQANADALGEANQILRITKQRADGAEAMIVAALALHPKVWSDPERPYCETCTGSYDLALVAYPCETVRALLGTDTPVSGPVAALPAEPEQP